MSASQGLEIFIQKRHRCVDCRRSWASVTRAKAHRDRGCLEDPATKACLTCRHNDPDTHTCDLGLLTIQGDVLDMSISLAVRRRCDGWEIDE